MYHILDIKYCGFEVRLQVSKSISGVHIEHVNEHTADDVSFTLYFHACLYFRYSIVNG